MQLIPAIEIRAGRLIRAVPADSPARTAVETDPIARAEELIWQGARWIHITDLDRVFADGDNNAVIARVIARVGSHVRLQLGGGLRGREAFEAVRDLEVGEVVVEAGAVNERRVEEAIEVFGATRVVLGLNVRDGMVTQKEWGEIPNLRGDEVVRHAVAAGIRTVIHRDVARDGRVIGADIAAAAKLQALGPGVIVRGGVKGLDDLVKAREAHLAGVIVGRALDEGRFTLREALRTASGA